MVGDGMGKGYGIWKNTLYIRDMCRPVNQCAALLITQDKICGRDAIILKIIGLRFYQLLLNRDIFSGINNLQNTFRGPALRMGI